MIETYKRAFTASEMTMVRLAIKDRITKLRMGAGDYDESKQTFGPFERDCLRQAERYEALLLQFTPQE